jgi:hypothetical protein
MENDSFRAREIETSYYELQVDINLYTESNNTHDNRIRKDGQTL